MNKENEQEHAKVEQEADSRHMVSFNYLKYQRLKKAYAKCAAGKTFMFEGNEYLKEYAGYLIQHLECVFKGGKNVNNNQSED